MTLQQQQFSPGEHALLLKGKIGQLEAVLTMPSTLKPNYLALLGHPHSLQGGTMHNKVVTTMARAFKELGIPSLRFNFRGVGKSEGEYDAGIGESEDMLYLMETWQKDNPSTQFLFAGFSFGSYVAYLSAAQSHASTLVTIAPPVHHYDYKKESFIPVHSCILQGDEDEVVPLSCVEDFALSFQPPLNVLKFEQTGHFFHGKLLDLKEAITQFISEQVL